MASETNDTNSNRAIYESARRDDPPPFRSTCHGSRRGRESCGARAWHRKRALEAVAARGWRQQRVTWRRGRR
ncbi:MAG: hypothetical protein Q6373_014875 [Candidatus Sigynarchaeota archaeon]